MRNFINIVETKLKEMERGGQIESDSLDYINSKHDFQNQQLDLFQELPGLDPQIPKGFEKVGRIGEYTVLRELNTRIAGEVMIVLIDKSKAIGWVSMLPVDSRSMNYPLRLNPLIGNLGGKGLQVVGVYVDVQHRGRKLGQQMYKWILENVCDYIVADETHTASGEALWRSLIKSPEFDVEVFNPDTLDCKKARGGKAWDLLYTSDKSWHKIPWVTLTGKSENIRSGCDNPGDYDEN